MTESLRIFIQEYIELMKGNFGFWRRHWKAFALITVVTIGAEVAIVEYNNAQYKIRKSNVEEDVKKIEEAIAKVKPEEVFEKALNNVRSN